MNDLEIDRWIHDLGLIVQHELLSREQVKKGRTHLGDSFKISKKAKELFELIKGSSTFTNFYLGIDENFVKALEQIENKRIQFEAFFQDIKPARRNGPVPIDTAFALALVVFITRFSKNKKKMKFLKECFLKENDVFKNLGVSKITSIPRIQYDSLNPSFWHGKLKDQLFKNLLSNPNKRIISKLSAKDREIKTIIEKMILEKKDMNDILEFVVTYKFSN